MNGSKIVGGGGAGAGLGAALVYAAGRLGGHLTSEDGALVATAAIAVCAFITHNGLRGALGIIWRGSGAGEDPTPPAVS